MNKKLVLFITTALMLVALASCGGVPAKYYNLTEVVIDDIPMSSASGSLIVYENNKGVLNFNGETADFEIDNGTSTVRINELEASFEQNDTSFTLDFEEIGLVLNFSQTDEETVQQEAVEISAPEYEGRFYFSNCDGIWEEYDNRTMALEGTVYNGVISLYNKAYSDALPMVYIVTENDSCVSGYVMAYKLNEFDAKIEKSMQNKDDVNDTKFLKPEEYIWNKYTADDTEQTIPEENMVEVTTITGTVANAEGGYDYKVIITGKAA